MAGSSFERTFEFKVNDTALKRATVRLFRSLERIEKKLDEIGGKGGKGFDAVAKGAEKAAASFKKVEAASNTFAKTSRRTREGIATLGFAIHGVAKTLDIVDAKLKAVTGLWGFAARKTQEFTGSLVAAKAGLLGLAAAHPVLTGATLAGVAAYTLFGSKTASVGKKLQGLVQGAIKAEAAVRKFVKSLRAPSGQGAELTIFDRIQSAKGGGLVGLRKLLDQVTAAQAKLISTNRGYVASSEQVRAVEKSLSAELMVRKKIMDQIIIGEQRRTPTSSLTAAAGEAGGLEGLKQLLAEAQGIQDRMLTTNENYKVASARVRNIQKAINAELERRDKIMDKINIKEEKSVSLGERLRGIGAKVAGQAAQAVRPGRGIERRGMIAGGVGGLAGLGMFSNTAVGQGIGTLGAKTMGFAGTAASAGAHMGIPGMGVVSKGVADTTTAMKGLVVAAKGVAAANVMNPAFVAALGVAWMAFGTKGFEKVIKGLWGVHKGSVSLLNQFLGVEKVSKKFDKGLLGLGKSLVQTERFLAGQKIELTMTADAMKKLGAATDETSKKLAGLGKNKGTILQNIRASRASRAKSGFAEWEESLRGTGTASARDAMVKSLERKNRRLVELGKEQLKGDRLINKEMKEQLKTSKQLEKSADRQQAKAKKRLENWKKIRGQKAENLMLGAGFPLLFGGGVGATAGGVGGSIFGNAMGMGGFGAQILGSAVGTIIDNAVQKVVGLQEALNQLNMDTLVESGIRLTGELQAQVELLKKVGNHERARAVVADQVRKQTGLTQGTMGDITNAVNLLKAAWDDVSKSVGGVLGIISAPLIVALAAILKLVSLLAQGFNTIAGALGNLLRLIPGSDRLAEAFKGLNRYLTNSRKEAVLLAAAMNKIGDTEFTRSTILGQKHQGLNLTYKQQRDNLGFDRDAMRMDFNAETRRLAKDIRTKNPVEEHNMLIKALNNRRSGEFAVADKPFQDKAGAIDRAEAESLRKLKLTNTMLSAQLGIKEKITAATKAGDTDTVARLNFESQKLSIQERLGEDLRKAKSVEEEVLLVKNAILEIDKARLAVTGRMSEAEQRIKSFYEQIGSTIKSGMVDAITSAIEGTKTLGEVAASVFRQISRAFINFGISQAFGKGGLGLKGFAEGGSVGGGKPIVVGEKGPEIFTPGKSGYITPNNQLGGTSNVTINVDAGGSSMQGDAEQAGQLGRMLAAAVQDEMARQKRPGGILY